MIDNLTIQSKINYVIHNQHKDVNCSVWLALSYSQCISCQPPCYFSLKVINGNLSRFVNKDIIQVTACVLLRKKDTSAELIESGGVQVSVSSRTEQQQGPEQSHINTQRLPGLCVFFGHFKLFLWKGLLMLRQNKTQKENITVGC